MPKRPQPNTFSLVGFPPNYLKSLVKFVPSYSPIRNIGHRKCPSCSEIDTIVEQEIKTQTHFVRDNQILKIKANNYFRNSLQNSYSLNHLRPFSGRPQSGESKKIRPDTEYNSFHSTNIISPVSRVTSVGERTSLKPKSQKELGKYKDNKDKEYDIEKFLCSEFSENKTVLSSVSSAHNHQDKFVNVNDYKIEHNKEETKERINNNMKNNINSNNYINNYNNYNRNFSGDMQNIEEPPKNVIEGLDQKYGISSKDLKRFKIKSNKKINGFKFTNKDFYYDKVKKLEKDCSKDNKANKVNKE